MNDKLYELEKILLSSPCKKVEDYVFQLDKSVKNITNQIGHLSVQVKMPLCAELNRIEKVTKQILDFYTKKNSINKISSSFLSQYIHTSEYFINIIKRKKKGSLGVFSMTTSTTKAKKALYYLNREAEALVTFGATFDKYIFYSFLKQDEIEECFYKISNFLSKDGGAFSFKILDVDQPLSFVCNIDDLMGLIENNVKVERTNSSGLEDEAPSIDTIETIE